MAPGHSTDTPIPRGASSRRSPSDSATTPYLETLDALLCPEIRPAIEAVETMSPPSPCCSINGPKISIPQMVAIRLTPFCAVETRKTVARAPAIGAIGRVNTLLRTDDLARVLLKI